MTGLVSSASATTTASWLASTVELAVAGDEVAFARIVATYHARPGPGRLRRLRRRGAGRGRRPGGLVDRLAQARLPARPRAPPPLARRRSPPTRPASSCTAGIAGRSSEIRVAAPDDPAGDPSAEIERLDLFNALRHLKPEDRALLALRYVGDLDSTEIGTLIGMSPSGVRGRLSRLVDRLRKELRDG